MELKVIQILQFNLFIPTTIEFAMELLKRLARKVDQDIFSEKEILVSIKKYINYLEAEYSNIEYRQSEKALIVVHCALARWCVVFTDFRSFSSKEEEMEAMSASVAHMNKGIGSGDLGCCPVVCKVQTEWCNMVQSLSQMAQLPHDRRVALEQFIITAIGSDESTVYDVPQKLSDDETVTVVAVGENDGLVIETPEEQPVKLVHSIPRNASSSHSPSSSCSGTQPITKACFSVVESTPGGVSSSSSPVDVMNLEEHQKDEKRRAKKSKDVHDLKVLSPSSKRLDLHVADDDGKQVKRQKT